MLIQKPLEILPIAKNIPTLRFDRIHKLFLS